MENLTNISLADQVRATKVPTKSAPKFDHLVLMIVTTFIFKVFVDQNYLIPESLPINKNRKLMCLTMKTRVTLIYSRCTLCAVIY